MTFLKTIQANRLTNVLRRKLLVAHDSNNSVAVLRCIRFINIVFMFRHVNEGRPYTELTLEVFNRDLPKLRELLREERRTL